MSSSSAQAAFDVADAFMSLLDAAEGGAWDVVPALRQLVADSDDVRQLLEAGDDSLAIRFDAIVSASKEPPVTPDGELDGESFEAYQEGRS